MPAKSKKPTKAKTAKKSPPKKTKRKTDPKKLKVKTDQDEVKKDQPETHEQLITETLHQLLEQLQVPAQAQAQFDPESEYYYVQIESENPGILIGYRGDTLSALQTMTNLLVQEALQAWPRVVLNVGDYRQRREDTLINLAKNAAQRVQFSGQPYTFGPLTPAERRIIHLALQDHPGVTTHSEGEHRHRRLVVTPK
jgi:spoIIIJ-associated protein